MTTFFIYEAKARFSEVMRMVREGRPVTITYRGDPVAEIHPIKESGGTLLERRVGELTRRGDIVQGERRGELKPLARKPGAMERFLEDRGE